LLIAKKCFAPDCARHMQQRLQAMGLSKCRVIHGKMDEVELANANVIPLIHYGLIGVNSFKEFDCAFCLTGFYVNGEIVNGILQDVLASDIAIPIDVSTEGNPLRRHAKAVSPKDRCYDVHHFARLALRQQEMDAVIQAVGRVRPFTQPREVITFQCDEHPAMPYDQEFKTLAAARAFFGIESERNSKKAQTIQAVKQARARGLKQREAAEKLSISLRSVQRYWNY
jgi:hypothetical protein